MPRTEPRRAPEQERTRGFRTTLVFLATGLLTGLLLGGVSGPSLAEGAWQRELQQANGWTWTTASELLGTDTLLRAAAARGELGALPATELLVYRAAVDETSAVLTGDVERRLPLGANGAPPADAFWTLTVYGADGSLAPASAGPRSIASDELAAEDAELDVLLARESPADGRAWLAVPGGAYQLVLRLYRPGADALAARWLPPAVRELEP